MLATAGTPNSLSNPVQSPARVRARCALRYLSAKTRLERAARDTGAARFPLAGTSVLVVGMRDEAAIRCAHAVASLGGRISAIAWTINGGINLDRASQLGTQTLGSSVDAGAGLTYFLNPEWRVGAEVDGSLSLAGDTATLQETPVELHGYGSWGDSRGLFATLGGGLGVVSGIGTPDVRLFFLTGLRGAGAPSDRDRDGFSDADDRCPDDPEDVDTFADTDGCPDPDNDRDGVTDGCILRRILSTGSVTEKLAIARAEQKAGRSLDRVALAQGLHTHDSGKTWHKH